MRILPTLKILTNYTKRITPIENLQDIIFEEVIFVYNLSYITFLLPKLKLLKRV